MPTKRYGRSTAPRRAALCAISALACVLVAPAAQAQATTQSFPPGNESTFRVPAGVTSVNVLAIGEAGGEEPFKEMRIHGGRPAEVRGELSVTGGQTLYVEVAGRTFNGGGCNFEPPPASRCSSQSGGGASDVRTSPLAAGLSPDPRRIVAGGGGGEGNSAAGAGGEGGVGGNAGEPGKSPATIAGFTTPEGGGAGTQTNGGAGGHGAFFNGTAGALGSGGIGGIGNTPPQFLTQEPEGGGGGGGYYGGGGGGGGNEVSAPPAGAGGGGGSSLVPAGGSMTVSAKVCGQLPTQSRCGLVQISYTIPLTVTKVEPNHGSPGGGTAVTITGTGFTGATAVKFGSTNAQSFTVNSESSISAVSPKGKGTVDVTVTTPAGTSQTSPADQFTFSRK